MICDHFHIFIGFLKFLVAGSCVKAWTSISKCHNCGVIHSSVADMGKAVVEKKKHTYTVDEKGGYKNPSPPIMDLQCPTLDCKGVQEEEEGEGGGGAVGAKLGSVVRPPEGGWWCRHTITSRAQFDAMREKIPDFGIKEEVAAVVANNTLQAEEREGGRSRSGEERGGERWSREERYPDPAYECDMCADDHYHTKTLVLYLNTFTCFCT